MAFISDVIPQHHGNGSSVYPYFVFKALRRQGIIVETVIPEGLSSFGRPYCWVENVCVVGWLRIGPLSVSVSAYEWALFTFRQFRKVVRGFWGTQGHAKPRALQTAEPEISSKARGRALQVDHALSSHLAHHPAGAIIVNLPYRLSALNDDVRANKQIIALTHDVISDRVNVYRQRGWSLDFEALTREEEAALLKSADTVIAISEDDRRVFSEMLRETRTVVCFPPMFDDRGDTEEQIAAAAGKLTCLFIGSGAAHNRETLDWILREGWPAATGAHPRLELNVVGGVGGKLNREALPPSVKVLGRVDDLEKTYREVDLSLSLVLDGSGVKMKLLEAVSLGVPAITTQEGLRGLPGDPHKVFPIVRKSADFAQTLKDLAASPKTLNAVARNQREWARANLNPDTLVKDLLRVLQ